MEEEIYTLKKEHVKELTEFSVKVVLNELLEAGYLKKTDFDVDKIEL